MAMLRTFFLMSAGALLLFAFTACDREVTYVLQESQNPSTCFDCHNDQSTELVAAEQQWAYSRHASGLNSDRNSGSCSGCHVSEGFIARAAGEDTGSYPNPTPIHCFTCHAPHTEGDFSLRVTEAELADGASFDLGAGNLCVFCHQSRRNVNSYVGETVTLSEHWGPHHGPQGDMVIGSNGYEYDGYEYEQLEYHRTLADDGCLDCHFRATSNFVVGGHSFNMRAELEGEELLNVAACNACHDDLDDYDYNEVQTDVAVLLEELHALLEAGGYVDAGGHPIDDVVVDGDTAGAVWNYLIVEEDRSLGVHNSDYMKGLLESSIEFLESK
jgi:hypothetical protein